MVMWLFWLVNSNVEYNLTPKFWLQDRVHKIINIQLYFTLPWKVKLFWTKTEGMQITKSNLCTCSSDTLNKVGLFQTSCRQSIGRPVGGFQVSCDRVVVETSAQCSEVDDAVRREHDDPRVGAERKLEHLEQRAQGEVVS